MAIDTSMGTNLNVNMDNNLVTNINPVNKASDDFDNQASRSTPTSSTPSSSSMHMRTYTCIHMHTRTSTERHTATHSLCAHAASRDARDGCAMPLVEGSASVLCFGARPLASPPSASTTRAVSGTQSSTIGVPLCPPE